MTAIIAARSSRTAATVWERTLLAASQRLELAAVRHMRHRVAAADREEVIRAVGDRQRAAQAAGALRMFER